MYLLFNMLFRLTIAFLFLKEISPEYSLERLMLKLKFQYFDHLMQRTDSLEKTLMLEKIEGRKRRGRQRIRWLDGSPTPWTWGWASSGSWWWTGKPGVLQSMGSQRVRHDWTELIKLKQCRLELSQSSQFCEGTSWNMWKFQVWTDVRTWYSGFLSVT